MSEPNKFTLYKIYYDNALVYIGRTKQPLQNRIRGHLFQKPMHRTIDINQVSKIEYTELPTEADMNLYEIYYILKYKPSLNVDDKTKDDLTINLPELEWEIFTTHLWDKWLDEINNKQNEYDKLLKRQSAIIEELRILRLRHKLGEISKREFDMEYDSLSDEKLKLAKLLSK